MPHFPKSALLCTLLAAAAASQQLAPHPVDPDPANLTGEHVAPQALVDTLPINHGAPALQQLLLKLRSRASLMFIVAHPDDEDGGLLTFESRGQGARVAMLTLTRGEGGQNLMSADFNDALGLIRTQELLAEDRYTGVDQFFGTEVDFGFSKTKEETLAQWSHDRVLYDAVRAVRLYRPLVLASVFVGGPTDGHGHHQVSGEICQEVFLAAADPKIFPEMGLPTWSPQAVYARVPFSRVSASGMFDYATGKTVPPLFHNYITNLNTTEPPTATVTIHEGDPAMIAGAPALGMDGMSYVAFARLGLARQKSQIGPGVRIPPPGRAESGYTLMASRACITGSACPLPSKPTSVIRWASTATAIEPDLFQGIDTSLQALAPDVPELAQIDTLLAQAQAAFTPANLELTAPPLRDALRLLDTLLDDLQPTPENYDLLHELRVKRVDLNQAILLAHGLTLTATLTDPKVGPLLTTVPALTANLTITDGSANSSRVKSTQLTVNVAGEGIGAGDAGALEPQSGKDVTIRLPYLAGLAATKPYFSRPNLDQPYYNIAIPNLRNAPQTPAPIVAHATIDDQGVLLDLAAIVPTPGSPLQPLVVVPPITVSLTPTAAILRPSDPSIPVTAHLLITPANPDLCLPTRKAPADAQLTLLTPATDKWTIAPANQPFDPTCPAANSDLAFTLSPPKDATSGTTLLAQALARTDFHSYNETYKQVGYPDLQSTNFYIPATVKAVLIDANTAPNLRVAYLPGTGDEVPAFLPNLGIIPTLITPADLTPESLARFDVILLGVRAYAAHPGLQGAGSLPLTTFAQQGGVVIAQYDSAGFDPTSAPFPYTLPGDSAHNVVEEADPVTLLAPKAALLNWPNAITSADFDHWTEERGHGFPSTWATNYDALLETHDPGQDPQRGGLLVAPVGKGAYIYCAFALYRQLPEAVPGAYRLLANLLSYVKNPQR